MYKQINQRKELIAYGSGYARLKVGFASLGHLLLSLSTGKKAGINRNILLLSITPVKPSLAIKYIRNLRELSQPQVRFAPEFERNREHLCQLGDQCKLQVSRNFEILEF